jgi:hypothetical protein
MSEQITIGSASGWVYGTTDERDDFLALDLRFASAWAALSDDDQNRASITASRYLNRRSWKGTKTSAVQPLAWPRTDATDGDGTEIGTGVEPTDIAEASYLLAGMLAVDPDILGHGQNHGRVQSLREGPIAVTFVTRYEAAGADGSGVVIIDEIENIIQGYLGDSSGISFGDNLVGLASGTDGESAFDDDKRYLIDGGVS